MPHPSLAAGWRARLREGTSLFTAAAIAALLLASALALVTLLTLNERMQRLEKTSTARFEVQRLLTYLRDAQRAQRAYVLTGRDRYLTPYYAARDTVTGQLPTLRADAADEPDVRAALPGLEQGIEQFFDALAEVVRLRQQDGLDPTAVEAQQDEIERQTDNLAARIMALETALDRRVQIQVAAAQVQGRTTGFALVVLISLSVVAFSIAARRLREEVAVRRVSEAALERERASLDERVRERTDSLAARSRELEEQRRRMETLISSLPGVAYRSRNGDGKEMLYVSPQVQALLGYAPEDFTEGRVTWARLIHPDDLAGWQRERETALAERRPYRLEYRMRTRDGQHVWVWEHGVGVLDAAGQLLAREGFVADVTERIRAEAALRDSEERYRSLIENSNDLIQSVAPDGHFLFVNQAWLHTLGFTAEELPALRLWDVLAPEEHEHCRALFTRVLSGEDVHHIETTFVHKDGRRIAVEGSATTHRVEGQGAATQSFFRDVTERRRAEEMRARLAAIVASSDDAIIGKTLDGVITSWNAGAERMYGYSAEEVVGRPISVIVPPERADEPREIMEKLRKGEPVEQLETVRRRKDGSTIDVSVSISPIKNAEGRTTGASSIARDITERKRAAEALRESEQRLQQAQNVAHLGYIEIDALTGKIYWSDETFRILGYAPQAFEPTPEDFFSRVHPDDVDHMKQAIQDLLEHGTASESEYCIVRPDGETRWAYGQGEVLLDGQGQPLRYVGTILDVTERKRAEEALRESEHRFRQLAESLPQLIWTCEPEGSCDYLSPQWVRYTGVPADEHLGYGWLAQLHPDDRDPTLAAWQEAVAADANFHVEFRLRRHDGAYRWLDTRAVPLRDAQGRTMKWFGSNTDITERKHAEEHQRQAKEAAEEANRMKSAFLANMSHEIRTPLTAMLGFAELLAARLGDEQQRFAEAIVENGRRLTETLTSILMLARLEAGRTTMNLQPLQVGAEVEELTALYRTEMEKKGLTLSVIVTPEARTARALLDRGSFSSVLQNLIGNAIKFTKAGGITVIVSLEQPLEASADGTAGAPPGRVQIQVKDTGIGMAPKFLAHLFEPYVQESTGFSRAYEGSGLGLTIARQLTEKMNGTITVESQKGWGSRFTVSFPTLRDDVTPAAEDPPPTAHRGGKRLLLVEDNDNTRVVMAKLLEDEYEVRTAATAREAIEAARHAATAEGKAFDVALVDINLGEGPNGYDVLKELRTMAAYSRTPIAAVTAYAMPGDREQILSEGFDAYLRKPFTAVELSGLVNTLLNEEP